MADLLNIPGIAELQELSLGDPGIEIALIDGLPDLTHPVFDGRRIRVVDPNGLRTFESSHNPDMREHATFVGSILVGDPSGPRPGIAPECSLSFIVAVQDLEDFDTRLAYVRALEAAYESRAPIVHSAIALPSQTARPDPMVERAARRLKDAGVLLISPAGNDHGTTWTYPATADFCLAVGNVDDNGVPTDSTNFGELFQGHAVMANGTRILGAIPGGGLNRQKGTSLSAPHVTGVAALLMSILRDKGIEVQPTTIGRAIIASAKPCQDSPERCIGGILDPMAALEMLLLQRTPPPSSPKSLRVGRSLQVEADLPPDSPIRFGAKDPRFDGAVQSAASLLPKTPKPAFVLGNLGFDIRDEVLHGALLMATREAHISDDPRDPQVLAVVLNQVPDVALEIDWLVMRDDSPLYALHWSGPYEAEIITSLTSALTQQISGVIDVMSFPGVVTGEVHSLSTDELIPVLTMPTSRGLYGWRLTDQLRVLDLTEKAHVETERMLSSIMNQEPNDGTYSHVRALNYLVTNPAQLAWSATVATEQGFCFESLSVQRSTLNRPYSNCWDIDLIFGAPERTARAKLMHKHSVDVGDLLPVSIGSPRVWRLAES
jgi:hypothetical protein